MKRYLSFFVLILVSIPLFGFLGLPAKANVAKPDKTVIATIGRNVITKEDFQNRIMAYPDQYQAIMSDSKSKEKILDQLIHEYLVYEYAKGKGYDRNTEAKQQLEIAKRQIAISLVIKNELQKETEVTDAEARKYYAQNIAQFQEMEERKLSHILVSDEATAKDVLASLQKGNSFEDLAAQKSLDPSGKRGGELGWFGKNGQLVKEFENAVVALKNKGDISDIIKTQFGYHIIKLDGISKTKKVDFNQAKPRIEQFLKMQKQEAQIQKLIETQKKKYKVTTDVSKI